jgi:hypothetical protein
VLIRTEEVEGYGRVDIHRRSPATKQYYLYVHDSPDRGFIDKETLEQLSHTDAETDDYERIMCSSLEEAEALMLRLHMANDYDPTVCRSVPLF